MEEPKETDPADLSRSEEDFEDGPSEVQLLEDIRNRLAQMEALNRQALQRAIQTTTVGKDDPVATL